MRYLHTMVRVKDLDASLHFYCTLFGLKEIRRSENEKGRFGALLHGIIESAPFQKRRTRANATLAENVESTAPATTTTGAKRKNSL